MTTFELITRIVVGGLFAAAGYVKLAATPAWRQLWLSSYHIVPTKLVRLVAYLLPLAELITGLIVFSGAFGRTGPIMAAILLTLVTFAVISALIRGLRPSCGCFGTVDGLISWKMVARNLVLLATTVILAIHGLSGLNLNRYPWEIQTAIMVVGLLATTAVSSRYHRTMPHQDTMSINNSGTLAHESRTR